MCEVQLCPRAVLLFHAERPRIESNSRCVFDLREGSGKSTVCKSPTLQARSDMDFGNISENEFVFQFHHTADEVVLLGVSQLASKRSLIRPEMVVFFDNFFKKKNGEGRSTMSPFWRKRSIFEFSTCKMHFFLMLLLSSFLSSSSPLLFSSLHCLPLCLLCAVVVFFLCFCVVAA